MSQNLPLQQLASSLEGDLFYDELHKVIYSTDASVYQIKPIAIARPKSVTDCLLYTSPSPRDRG